MSRLLLRPVVSMLLLTLSACGLVRPVAEPATNPAANPVVDQIASQPVDGQAAASEVPAAEAVAAPEGVEPALTPEAAVTPPAGVPQTVAVDSVPLKPRNGWVARFFWSPEYCDKNRGSKEPQCTPLVQGFVLRDLIHVVNGRDVDDCVGGSLLMSPVMLEQVSRFTKNKAEARASWRLYGRCSGLSEIDYASWTEFVDRRMSWPAKLVPGGKNVSISAAELVATLAEDNPGLTAETMVFQCNRSYLKSVDLSWTKISSTTRLHAH